LVESGDGVQESGARSPATGTGANPDMIAVDRL